MTDRGGKKGEREVRERRGRKRRKRQSDILEAEGSGMTTGQEEKGKQSGW